MQADVKASDYEKVLVALKGATRLSRSQVRNLFGRHRSPEQLDALANALETDGRMLRLRLEPAGGNERRPTEVWEIIKAQSGSFVNGSVPASDDSPPGEGWLPKAKTLRQARRGVVPAVAARAGRIARKKDRARRGTPQAGQPRVSDEQRGATKLIGQAYKSYRHQGIIEEQGDWVRLVKNPTRRPPHHWYESLLQFVAAGHPTLDGKWRRKPKRTLIGVMEDALGQKLPEGVRVRRWPGTAGSWNPDDIILYCEDRTILTLAEIQAGRQP